MGFAIYISAIHRYVQIAPLSWFYRQYHNIYFRAAIYIFSFIAVQLIIVLPLIVLRISPDVLEKETLASAPQLEYFFIHESSIFGYVRNNDVEITKFIYVLIGMFGILIISLILLTLNFFRIMKKNNNTFEHRAYKYQVRSQLIVLWLYVVIPPK